MSAFRLARVPLRLSLIIACLWSALMAQVQIVIEEGPGEESEPAERAEAAPQGPQAPPEYQGFSTPRVDDSVATELAAADKAIEGLPSKTPQIQPPGRTQSRSER